MDIYALGFEFAARTDWASIITIKPPKNYKKKEAIDKYIAERTAVLEAGGAAEDPLTMIVTRVVAIDCDDNSLVLDTPSPDAFCTWAKKDLRVPAACVLAGNRIFDAFRAIAQGLISTEHDVPAWLLGLDKKFQYGEAPGYIDPLKLLYGSSDVDPYAVIKSAGLEQRLLAFNGDAKSMAELSTVLVDKLVL